MKPNSRYTEKKRSTEKNEIKKEFPNYKPKKLTKSDIPKIYNPKSLPNDSKSNSFQPQKISTKSKIDGYKPIKGPMKNDRKESKPIRNKKINQSQIPQKLNKGESYKKCNKCNTLKHESQYSTTQGINKDKRRLRYVCKQCANTHQSLMRLDTKKKILLNIYNEKYHGKCSRCPVDYTYLPVLEFHHQEPERKTLEWENLPYDDWKKTMRILENEKTEILCRNCHLSEQATIFLKYEDTILKQELNKLPGKLIDNNIYENIKKSSENYNKTHKRVVIDWIKKRHIIETLYNGKCVGCKEKTIKNLPELVFHHTSNDIEKDKPIRWKTLRNYDIPQISKKLISEKCVCLCGNCHKLIHSEIFKQNYEKLLDRDKSNELRDFYRKIDEDIRNFNITNIEIRDPLERIYNNNEKWKRDLLSIKYLEKYNNNPSVEVNDLVHELPITRRSVNKNIEQLINRNLIKIKKLHNMRYIILTEDGNKELELLIHKLKPYQHLAEKTSQKWNNKEIDLLVKYSKFFI